MNKVNYQQLLDGVIENCKAQKKVPSLLLHACCAPCSSYCLEYLSKYFNITVFYFNPNISLKKEYEYRLCEEKRLISMMKFDNKVEIIEGDYLPHTFYNAVKGFENDPEGGKRCELCFKLRLEEAAKKAAEIKADYVSTTLTISPLKNADTLNRIGKICADKYAVKWLYSNFKKREGYKRSIILSKQYNLYRQNYCGCIFSKPKNE